MEGRRLHGRLAALAAGVAIAAAVVVATHLALPAQGVCDSSLEYGYVYSGAKSSSAAFVRAAMDEDSLLVLGSSEFSTPARLVPQVPAQVFGTSDHGLRLMLVGEAFDQCLWDAIALGALAEDGLPRGKVAVIVGLGQFTDGGLDASTFGERFSYDLYARFCANGSIPASVRAYVAGRLVEQGVDETTVRSGTAAGPLEAIDGLVLSDLADLRLRSQLGEVRGRGIARAEGPATSPDWEALRADALATAHEMSTTNSWGVEDAFYTGQLEPALEGLAGARAGETYTQTPEYADLACFLDVCDACGIEPLVVIQPVLGPYYDHIGIGQGTREAAYQRIRAVVAEHASARLADFSGHEYEPYFLYDIVHFGWTGWVDAEQAIYEFAMGEGGADA